MEGSDASAESTEGELDRRLTRSEVEQLVRSGIIDLQHRKEVCGAYRESVDWSGWLQRWTGAIGAIFLLAGVMFFFAFNWKEMSPLMRFGVLETGVAGCVLAAAIARFRGVIGQWLLAGACVLTGVLIAVYGQVYQTGADAFEVFALWSCLMLVWVVVARFAPLWVFWLVISETALLLYGGQVLVPDAVAGWSTVFLAVGGVTFLFLAAWEWMRVTKRFEWLHDDWIRTLLVGGVLFWLSAIMWRWIFDFGYRASMADLPEWIGLIAWLGAILGGIYFYTKARRSVLCMSLCVLDLAVILACVIGRVVLEDSWDEPVGWFVAAILTLGIFGGATAVILRLAKAPGAEMNSPTEEAA